MYLHWPAGGLDQPSKKLVMISTYNTMCNPFDHAMYMCIYLVHILLSKSKGVHACMRILSIICSCMLTCAYGSATEDGRTRAYRPSRC